MPSEWTIIVSSKDKGVNQIVPSENKLENNLFALSVQKGESLLCFHWVREWIIIVPSEDNKVNSIDQNSLHQNYIFGKNIFDKKFRRICFFLQYLNDIYFC